MCGAVFGKVHQYTAEYCVQINFGSTPILELKLRVIFLWFLELQVKLFSND
jgi:hypothetical protein